MDAGKDNSQANRELQMSVARRGRQQNSPQMDDEQWRHRLSPQRYEVLRERATEPAWSGEHLHTADDGVFVCGGCGADLFSSKDKFDSGTGWPSFDKVIDSGSILEVEDRDHAMIRTEIRCASCEGHLGHLFDDGPTETGLRYCVNSLSLEFSPEPPPPSRTPGQSSEHT